MKSLVLPFLAIFGTWNSVSNHVSPGGYAFLKGTNSLHFLWESKIWFFEFYQFWTYALLKTPLVCRIIIFSLLSRFWLELCRFLVGLGHFLKYLSTDIFIRKCNETIAYLFLRSYYLLILTLIILTYSCLQKLGFYTWAYNIIYKIADGDWANIE